MVGHLFIFMVLCYRLWGSTMHELERSKVCCMISFGWEVARGPNVELIGLTLVPRSE
jgi:hypothetical protein